MLRVFSVLLTVSTVLGPAAVGLAQEPTPAAERFRRAVARYESSQYEAALRDFQGLYEDTEEPALLYNIARCQEQLGDLNAAATSLRRYLDRVPNADDREDAAELLADIEARQTQAAATPTGPTQTEPTQADPNADPSPPTEVPAVEPPDSSTPSTSEPGLSALSATGIALLAVGGAGLLTGAVLGGLTASEHGSLSEGCGAGGGCSDEQLSGLRALGAGADVGLFVGGGVALVGVVLWIVGLSEGDTEAQAALDRVVRF